MFGSWRVSDGKAGSEILVIVRPIGLLPIGLAGNAKLDWIIERLPRQHGLRPLVEPGIQACGRRNLYTVLLVRRLQQCPPQSEGEGEVGLDAPGILHISFKLVRHEMTDVGSTLRQGVTLDRKVVSGVNFADDSRERHYRVVVRVDEAVINCGQV